jgi:hypothetical protein
MLNLDHILLIALAAIGWSDVITSPGMIFGSIRKAKIPKWVSMPLYECSLCVAGQMALWYWVILPDGIAFQVFKVALIISAGVGLTYLIKSKT